MNRLWGRVGTRAAAIALLAAGLAGGIQLGLGRPAPAGTRLSAEVDAQLLRRHQATDAASRDMQRLAEGHAAVTAAVEARTASGLATTLERKVRDRKAADAAKKTGKARTGGYDGPIPSSCGQYSGNRAIGCALMLKAGFTVDQFPCLDKLWSRESGWNQRASNAGSGAYGIPQARPGSKMQKYGDDWRTNPATQIEWGLQYVQSRYSSPCGAWGHSQSTGWY